LPRHPTFELKDGSWQLVHHYIGKEGKQVDEIVICKYSKEIVEEIIRLRDSGDTDRCKHSDFIYPPF
jgi:hypothetical protein